MSTLPIFQVDAFASEPFTGNPAAVVPLDTWLPDAQLQAIAAENNLAETAFFVPAGSEHFQLRWFTPSTEVDLCGHATLATASVLMEQLQPGRPEVRFLSKGGELSVVRLPDGRYEMDFPARPPEPCAAPDGLVDALGGLFYEVLLSGEKYVAVFGSESDVAGLAPDFRALAAYGRYGFIATARGERVDFVSRFFAPAFGIDEDPVTGSAHCVLTPLWAGRLHTNRMRARQISARGGDLEVALAGDRVKLRGAAVLYLRGEIRVG